MFDYSKFSISCIFRGARPWSLKEVRECLLCSESASAPSWLAWVEDSYIQTVFFMTYVGLSSPACMAAVLACSSVLPRTTLFGEKSYGDTWGSQTWTTCIVPIVFSRLLFKSPPDLKGVYIFQFVMIHFFWITLPTRLWLRRWTSLQCQQRQQGTWGSAPTDKQVIS